MYELIQVSGNSYYIQSPAKIGLVKLNETDVCLIDSGSDKDAGKKVKKHLDANGWRLQAIYNTHSNADHIGGNRYLQEQTGCRIYAPGIECAFTNYPVLEPAFLYGARPVRELQHKFLMAQESRAEPLSKEVLPGGFEILPLPGHFFDMVGFMTPDGVAYIADSLSSRETLEKYRIGFIYDVGAYLETLEGLKTLKAKQFVPSHAPVTDDLSELIACNIGCVHEIEQSILKIAAEPVSFEMILKSLFDFYHLTMTFELHALVGSTVRSYLAHLKDTGRISAEFSENMLLWKAE